MKIAVYPGSFDPVTYGHLDIIERAARIFDQLVVTVFPNVAKNAWFSHDERVEMIKECTQHLPNVSIERFDGLLVDFAQTKGAQVIVKGLRAVSDFDYEFKMALMNKKLAPDIETVFIMTSSRHLYLSSSLVKEVYGYGACIEGLVPPPVIKRWTALADTQK